MDGTRFGILGPVEVEGPEGPVRLRGSKRRALLVRLLISANHHVPVDRLVDDLWEGSPGAGAVSTLSSHISLLRNLVGAERITGRTGTYCFNLQPGELDASAFEAATIAGRRARHRSDLPQARQAFEKALMCWRGGALADVDGAPWAQSEITRLDELRFGAEESLLEVRMDLGLHRDVVADAEAAVDAQPLREHRWAFLMLALYRCGRQADALRTFQRLNRFLDSELGLEPSADLVALEAAIVQQSPAIGAPINRDSTSPAFLPGHSAPNTESRESKTVTVLVTRWTNVRAVTKSMNVDAFDALRRSHFASIRDVVSRLAAKDIKGLSDGLLMIFSSSSAALEAAVVIQQEVDRENRQTGTQIHVGIGVAVGGVTVMGDGDFCGRPVVEASRLGEAARGGQILVTELVRTMAGERSRALLFGSA